MERKDFLKGVGLVGLGLALPINKVSAAQKKINAGGCVLIPTETAGPFPLDLTENSTFFRQDIRETKTGVQLNLKLKIIGLENCLPMQNVRVNIWHCDKDGLYSGYDQTNNAGQAGLTYLRGYQFADANGEVNFTTIFPGWYSGRICHIHFQVYVSSSYAAISQLTFDPATKNGIYAANSSLYTKGNDPMTLATDNIFSDGYSYQMANIAANGSGGYDASLEVTIQGAGVTTGLGHLEKENAKQFTLGQNYPNPYSTTTTIPFTLKNDADVSLDLWDLNGRKVATLEKASLPAGEHTFELNMATMGLAATNYVYQLQITNSYGVYRDCKMMTATN